MKSLTDMEAMSSVEHWMHICMNKEAGHLQHLQFLTPLFLCVIWPEAEVRSFLKQA